MCRVPFFRFAAKAFTIALVLLVSVSLAPRLAAAEPTDPAYESWFQFGDNVLESWIIEEVPNNPYEVHIRSRDAASTEQTQKIFVIYPRRSSAYNVAITEVLSVLAEKGIDADITVANFRKDGKVGKKLLARAERESTALIFSMGSESTAWLHANYWGGRIPVVSVCSKDPVLLGQTDRYDRGTGTNFAFTSLNMPADVQFSYILDFMPEPKNFAILVDSKNVSAVETQAKPMAALARQEGIRVIELAVQDPKNAKAELAKLVRSAVATMRKNDPTLSRSLFWITGSTSVFREIATINRHSDRVPVLSVVPDVVKAGDDSAVLAIGISFESNARLAAIYGTEVLSGQKRAGDLPVGIVSPPDIAINFRKAREIGLEIPFNFFETATYVYDVDGQVVRK